MVRVRVELDHLKFNPSRSTLDSVSNMTIHEKVGPRATVKRKFNSCSWTSQKLQNCVTYWSASFILSTKWLKLVYIVTKCSFEEICQIYWKQMGMEYGVLVRVKSRSRSLSSLIVLVRSFEGTFHWCLRARDHWSLKSLIGRKHQDSYFRCMRILEHLLNACLASNSVGGLLHFHICIRECWDSMPGFLFVLYILL